MCLPGLAEAPAAVPSPVDPLPQDTGALGLKQMLLRLQTTAHLMQTTAHPDDEDGGMLTLESRGKGASVLLLTLNRGEGGQNKVGSNLFDVLGVLRTLELTASIAITESNSGLVVWRILASLRARRKLFKVARSRLALGDMVRVIRAFCPDVLVARFSGTERDGHGHHQASAIRPRKLSRRCRPQSLSGADQGGSSTLATEKALHRQRMRVWSDNLPARKLHGQTEHWRIQPGSGHVICAICYGGLEASAFSGSGGVDG